LNFVVFKALPFQVVLFYFLLEVVVAKIRNNIKPITVMKLAKKSCGVEVVCVVSGNRSVHLRLNSGTSIGCKSYKKYRDFSSSDLCAKLLEMVSARLSCGQFDHLEAEGLLLEMIRRAGVLKRKWFRSGCTYCISCTCMEVDTGKYYFHVAGVLDTTEIIAERRDTEADDILQHAFNLIGGNAEYDKAKYDHDAFLQELKADVGGVYDQCDCHTNGNGCLYVKVAPASIDLN
jgi:hypothetical protein